MTTAVRPGRAAPQRSRAGLAGRLLYDQAPTRGEVALYAAVLAVATAVLLGEHVRESGWYSDDWSYRAFWKQNSPEGFWGQLGAMLDAGPLQGRPTLAVYLSLTHGVLGDRQGFHLGWAAVLAVAFSASAYLLLRILRLRPLDAGLIGLLLLMFPASDSTRIWAMISDAQVAMSLALCGVACSLAGLGAAGRRRRLLRVAGLVLVVLGVTTYELTFAALLLAFVLYRTRVGWRETLRWAVVDWIVLALTYVLVLRRSTAEQLPLDDAISHAWVVFKETFTLFATVALPFDSVAAAVVVAALILLAAILVARTLDVADPSRAALVRWLWTAALAVVMLFAAYVIYGPSSPMYRPLAPGLLNRTNAFAALPMLVLVYALCALTGSLIFRGLRDGRILAAAGTAVLAIGIGIDYTSGITRNLKLWDSAWARAHASLELVYAALQPPPPRQALVVLFGTPIEEVEGVPVWSHYWDFDGALRLRYNDTTLRGRPAFPGTVIECRARDAKLTNPTYPSVVLGTDDAAYGYFYFVDANTGANARPRNERECQAAVPKFAPGPMRATDPGARDPG